MRDVVVLAVTEEMERAREQYGRLTPDHCRAATILMEEVGEVSRELLGIKRAINFVAEQTCRERATLELVQVIATATNLIDNLGVL